MSRRLRSIAAGLLIVLTAVAFLAASLGIWVKRNTLDTDVWVDRVGPLAAEPEVKSALATYLTDQITSLLDLEEFFTEVLPEQGQILAGPLSGAVADFVHDRVDGYLASDEFEELWIRLNERAHTAVVGLLRGESELVEAGEDTVTVDLVPVINRVLERIGSRSPELLGREVDIPTVSVDDVPSEARERLGSALGVELDDDFGTVTVYDGGKLESAQSVVELFDRFVVLSVLLTVVLGALAIWASIHRRRAALYLLAAFVVDLVLVRRAAFRLQEEIVGLVRIDENRGAVREITGAFVDPLVDGAEVILWVIGVVALVLLLAGPSRPAQAVRDHAVVLGRSIAASAQGRTADPRVAAWVREHEVGLQLGGVVGAVVLLWFLELSWLGVLLLLVLLALWELAVSRLAAPPSDLPATGR